MIRAPNTNLQSGNFSHRNTSTGHQSSGSDSCNCNSNDQNASTSFTTPQTGDLATIWDEGKLLYVFVKCFTKFLKVKRFKTSIEDFTVNVKYFINLTTFYMQTTTLKLENIFWKILYFKTNGALSCGQGGGKCSNFMLLSVSIHFASFNIYKMLFRNYMSSINMSNCPLGTQRFYINIFL